MKNYALYVAPPPVKNPLYEIRGLAPVMVADGLRVDAAVRLCRQAKVIAWVSLDGRVQVQNQMADIFLKEQTEMNRHLLGTTFRHKEVFRTIDTIEAVIKLVPPPNNSSAGPAISWELRFKASDWRYWLHEEDLPPELMQLKTVARSTIKFGDDLTCTKSFPEGLISVKNTWRV